ncbi:hypothetical protein NLG07_00535 [Alteromonas sp. LMIT006]|uniref:hypothetical protein n=1 Tax=Alteromonadaceae TaxID=72275 RepID=UPI0020CA89CB|nr:hypothetical protein [Alteromonas sp. LMIT006]UTP72760.1 hypothetical protein NLG07_00535 [Alteromonas sp. LMIT006]
MKLSLIIIAILLAGCKTEQDSSQATFSLHNYKNEKLVRLNAVTGEVCIINENCDVNWTELSPGEMYLYNGNGELIKKSQNIEIEQQCFSEQNCTDELSKLITGASYTYMGDGKFKYNKTIRWRDLPRN